MKILIEIEDGSITNIITSEKCEIIILDRDNEFEDMITTQEPDIITTDPFYQQYYETDPVETEIRDTLKTMKI